jgi:hypothetical protein
MNGRSANKILWFLLSENYTSFFFLLMKSRFLGSFVSICVSKKNTHVNKQYFVNQSCFIHESEKKENVIT